MGMQDNAHAAASDQLNDLILSEHSDAVGAGAGGEKFTPGFIGLVAGHAPICANCLNYVCRLLFQKTSGVLVSGEQDLHPSTQLGLVTADFVQKSGTLLGTAFVECFQKNSSLVHCLDSASATCRIHGPTLDNANPTGGLRQDFYKCSRRASAFRAQLAKQPRFRPGPEAFR